MLPNNDFKEFYHIRIIDELSKTLNEKQYLTQMFFVNGTIEFQSDETIKAIFYTRENVQLALDHIVGLYLSTSSKKSICLVIEPCCLPEQNPFAAAFSIKI